jgi:hypothetical protein
MVYFQTKILNFGRSCNFVFFTAKWYTYFTAIWYNLWSFGIYIPVLVYVPIVPTGL